MAVSEQAIPKAEPQTVATPKPTSKPGLDLDTIINEMERSRAERLRVDREMAATYAPALGITAPAAALKFAFGRDFGFNEVQSLQWVHIIPGKGELFQPSMDYKGRSFLLRRAGYNWLRIEHTGTVCHYGFYYGGEALKDNAGKPLELKYTLEDAMAAGLVQRSRGKDPKPEAKGTYDSFGQEMLFARMITRFHKFHASEVAGTEVLDINDVIVETERRQEQEAPQMPGRMSERAENAPGPEVAV